MAFEFRTALKYKLNIFLKIIIIKINLKKLKSNLILKMSNRTNKNKKNNTEITFGSFNSRNNQHREETKNINNIANRPTRQVSLNNRRTYNDMVQLLIKNAYNVPRMVGLRLYLAHLYSLKPYSADSIKGININYANSGFYIGVCLSNNDYYFMSIHPTKIANQKNKGAVENGNDRIFPNRIHIKFFRNYKNITNIGEMLGQKKILFTNNHFIIPVETYEYDRNPDLFNIEYINYIFQCIFKSVLYFDSNNREYNKRIHRIIQLKNQSVETISNLYGSKNFLSNIIYRRTRSGKRSDPLSHILYYPIKITNGTDIFLIVYFLLDDSTFYISYETSNRGIIQIKLDIPVYIDFENKIIYMLSDQLIIYIDENIEIYKSLFKVFLKVDEENDDYQLAYLPSNFLSY